MHQVAGGQVSPPSGPKTPQEDSAGEGARMEKDQELHEVPAGRSLEPDHKKGEEPARLQPHSPNKAFGTEAQPSQEKQTGSPIDFSVT
ncbi:hypothetical protein EYF80_006143 [Liparis tanakae]|uniref:Uncharacterized protein n=1 Tax=Liparis tanakae TaxID=230148 RepID=A0A4Z2IZX1_9TELE|nr:hypothetical protein EYF80_006143 [Liparis tanakae]